MIRFTKATGKLYYGCNQQAGWREQLVTPKEQSMRKIFKSDLTYSLGGGFIVGALMLFCMQPAEQRADFGNSLSATVSAASHLLG